VAEHGETVEEKELAEEGGRVGLDGGVVEVITLLQLVRQLTISLIHYS
jgi:hypothetical protein